MRRLSFTLLLLTLVCVPAALASGSSLDGNSAVGDGALSVINASGSITVVGKGTIYGQIEKGTIAVTDPDPTDGPPMVVVGAEHTTHSAGSNVTTYSGKDITFRGVSGRYKIVISAATGIDFLAVGVGKAWLKGDPTVGPVGSYTVDGAKMQPLPVASSVALPAGTTWAGQVVPFGVQPTTTTSP
jgi:hypothetical protein